MQGPTQNQWTWQERLIAELKHDKKKAVLLGVLAIVAVALILQQVASATPAETSASPAPSPTGASASDADPGMDATASAARSRALTDAARRRNEYLRTMDRKIQRDLFAPNRRFFAPPKEPTEEAPAKKTPEQIEQERREAIRMQAQALALQSTIVGTTPTAVIDGMVLRKGEWVGGFEVTEIKPRSCTVRKDGVSVVLKME
jgi:hypothetical protein